MLGPISVQLPGSFWPMARPFALMFVHAFWAFSVSLDGHLGRGIGAVQVILLRRPEDVHLLGITRRNVVTVPTIAGLSAGSSQRLGAQLRGEGGCRASARRAVAGRQHVGCY